MSIFKRKTTIWLSFGLAMGIYILMLGVTLPQIAEYANGEVAFDMRPMGYSQLEAQTFITALSQQGRQYYLFYQLALDLFYPALLAIFLFGALNWFASNVGVLWRITLVGAAYFALIGAALDYAENVFIAIMLITNDAQVTIVQMASTLTIAKSTVTTLVFLILLAAATHHLVRVLLSAPKRR